MNIMKNRRIMGEVLDACRAWLPADGGFTS